MPLAQSTVSKHLIELKKANIVSEYFVGKKTIFSLKREGLTDAEDYLMKFIANCKYKNAFASQRKNLDEKSNKLKPKNRTANPALKQHNYIFQHKKNGSI